MFPSKCNWILHALSVGFVLLLTSCGSTLKVPAVAYQSVINVRPDLKSEVPADANILASYAISPDGGLEVTIQNLTDDLMVIDQTRSFFLNSNGSSTSYYDPTVHTSTTTDIKSGTKGATVNLGAVASALNVGGAVGRLASGINVGGSTTSGQVVSNTDYIADQPKITIAPHGKIKLDKVYGVNGLGRAALVKANAGTLINLTAQRSYCTFGVTLTYSVDGEETFNQFTSEFTANSLIKENVQGSKKCWKVNDALRKIYESKPNALAEPWYLLYFQTEGEDVKAVDAYYSNSLYDYQ